MVFRSGHTPWNKGIKGSTGYYWLGKKRSEEMKLKVSNTKKGSTPWNKGKIGVQRHTDESRFKISTARKNQILPIKNTKPERFMQSILSVNGIKYKTHKSFKMLDDSHHQVDIFIEPNLCLEVDGDYWHSRPEIVKRDKTIDKSLNKLGYDVLRIREKNIINNTSDSINCMIDYISELNRGVKS